MTDAKMRLTEKYQVMPSMPPEQFEALKADIAERGVLVPIDVDEDGDILDGHHRYRACQELGITDFPTTVRPCLFEEERRIFARKSNMLRRHLSRAQVRHLIAEQLKDTPSWANNRIAQVLGADSKTVASVREKLERTSEIPKFDKLVGADGKARPVKQKRPPAISACNVDELQKILKQIAEGADIEEIQGFLSAQGFESQCVIYDSGYNPFHHCDEAGEQAWFVFMLFLVQRSKWTLDTASGHIEWLLQKQFKTPDEWLGEEGAKFRRQWNGRDPSQRFLKRWNKFHTEHEGKALSDIEALLKAEAAK